MFGPLGCNMSSDRGKLVFNPYKRYGLFMGSGVEPHWRVWTVKIVCKKVNAETKKRSILLFRGVPKGGGAKWAIAPPLGPNVEKKIHGKNT